MTEHNTRATEITSRTGHARRAPLSALALMAGLFGLIGGGTALADDTSDTSTADATVAPVTSAGQFTLPLFGTGLTIDVTTDPGGTLSSVAVVTDPTGLVATEVRPREVEIVNEDGTAKVVVRSNKGGQRVEARAGSLAEITGPGRWSGEIFPGVPGSVAFEIIGTDGVPGIVIGAVDGPGADVGAVEVSTDDDEQEANVRITFRLDGMKRSLTIKASVETRDGDDDESDESDDSDDSDDEPSAKVKITLSKITSLPFARVEPGTTTAWTGSLCNATAASIAYTVNTDGTLGIGEITPTASQKVEGNTVEVKFETGEKVRITVRNADGALAVKVDEKLRCKNPAAPSVNVPVKDDRGKPGKGDDSTDGSDGSDHDDSADDSADDSDHDAKDDSDDDSTGTTEPSVTTPDSDDESND